MKIIFVVLSIIIFGMNCMSQDISGKQDWKTKKDFKKSEKQVASNIIWIESNPNLDDDPEIKKVYNYVGRWSLGCPYITVKMDPIFYRDMAEIKYEYSAHMYLAYMFGKTLYGIENKEYREVDANYRGVIGMINTYNSIIRVKGEDAKDDTMEYYKELLEKNELMNYVIEKTK